MINQKIAKILYEMSELLEMDEIPFKPAAYEKAADSVENFAKDLKVVYKEKGLSGLEEVSGVGKGIAERIEEFIKTGHIQDYEELKKKIPVDISALTSIEGIGPKLIKLFYKELKIKNLRGMERAARAGKISQLPRCGKKLEEKILKGVEFYKKSSVRFLLGDVYNLARKLEKKYKGMVAGSFRRQEETVGDLDILIPRPHPDVGQKRKTLRFGNGLKSDLRFVDEKDWGSALQFFTGNKEHNIELRKLAIKKGFKLNEYGIKTEEEVYKKLGMQFIPPEMRNNAGEIELARKNKLPRLIEEKDIKGDLHIHSHFNVDKKFINEMIRVGVEKGYEYIGISDHTKFLRIEHGLNEQDLLEQAKEIARLNSKFNPPAGGQNSKFRILHGCEANILADGSIDISDEVLEKLDYVIAGVHSQMKMLKSEMTERIIKAMKNPNVDIISHPTGRILQRRDEYEVDFDEILRVAKETGAILEINANPLRLDLKDTNIRKAKEAGVKMIINTDAHRPEQMNFMKFGIGQARRGWAEKKDIVNTMSLEEMMGLLGKQKE